MFATVLKLFKAMNISVKLDIHKTRKSCPVLIRIKWSIPTTLFLNKPTA